jgi:RNA polymerase sigma-54 factor
MATELVQQQSMRQEQTMTHHQIQALEMLFSPVMELSSIITGELEKNPVLEVEAEKYEKLEIEDVNNEEVNGSNETDEWVEKILQLDSKTSFGQMNSSPIKSETDERRHFLDSLTTTKTLHDHLMEQLVFMNLDESMKSCCDTIVSGLNDDGYLTSHPADLSMVTGEKVEDLHEAIKVIQKLEPAGIGAKDLRERLMLQLERAGEEDSVTYQAIDLYLDDIASNRLPKVAKTMDITMTEVHQIIQNIQNLTPHLTNHLPVLPQNYIEEEVEVIENLDGTLKVKVNNGRLPSLKISPYYKKMLSNPELAKDAKEYIKSKINGGVFLINSLMQRQSTIEKITHAITQEQEDFFKNGLDHLKPLTMSQIADASEVHETTVSRAVSGKYLKCKYGLFPLRFFFTPGYTAADGNTISNATVKKAIKEHIAKEDSRKPLSDSQLAKILKDQGLKVARRTVAKYRESLSILPSNLRRQY